MTLKNLCSAASTLFVSLSFLLALHCTAIDPFGMM